MSRESSLATLPAFIAETLDLWNVPGAAVAVVKADEILLCEGFGWRNTASQLPVTANTLFPIASCTKAFTAATLALLVDEGKLDWDTPIREYLPTFRLQDAFASERMTARDLLSHRSGLPRHDLMWYASRYTRQEIFDRLRYLEPSRDFRTAWQYQNMMYMVAGLLVTAISGSSWEAFVQQRIFDLLGMSSSNFSTVATQQSPDFATPYQELHGQLGAIPFFTNDGEKDAMGPAGSIIATVNDMARWLRIHVNGGKYQGEPFISANSLEQMHSPHMVINDATARQRFGSELSSYGLGWFIHVHKGQVLLHHGGNIDGFSALTSFLPREQLGVVVLTNAQRNGVPSVISYTVYDRLLGLAATDWNARFKSFYDDIKAAEAQSKTRSVQKRQATAPPSHPIAAFTGEYEHPAYGVMAIRQVDGQLQLVLNDKFTLPLNHYHYDYFEGYFERFDLLLKVAFSSDANGNIAQAAVQLEPAVKDIVFVRRADPRLNDVGFLAQFVGVYDLMELQLTVVLKGKTLVATLPGQATYILLPYQGDEFQLKGMPGYSLEFQRNAAGAISAAIFTQPTATFTARRRAADPSSSGQ